MKTSGGDNEIINSSSESGAPMNPAGGGLTSSNNLNTQTSSEMSKNHNGLVSVPQPLSKLSAGRLFSSKKRIIIVVIVVLLAVVVATIMLMTHADKKDSQSKYKFNTCSEKAVGDAIDNYKNNKPDAIAKYSESRLGDDGYNYDAKCMYIGALEAKMRNIKTLTMHYIEFYNKTSDKKMVDELVASKGGESMDSIKKYADSMKADIKDENDVLNNTIKPADLPPEMETTNEKTD